MTEDCICVVIEGAIRSKELSHQLLTKAREIADSLNYQVAAICAELADEKELEQLYAYGADVILHCAVNTEDGRQMADVLQPILNELEGKKLVLFPATRKGQAVAAILAVRFGVGLTAECIDIKYENGFIFTRAAMNSTVMAEISVKNSAFGMCTIKENAFKKAMVTKKYKKNLLSFMPRKTEKKQPDGKDILVKRMKKTSRDIYYTKNDRIVFGCGRGVITSGCLELFLKVAEKYQAGIACTKPVVEQGKIGFEKQVGQSGKNITPYIYVAFGVSGASQHIAGIMNASIIIAVNKDESAPIFQFSNYKLIADVRELLTELLHAE